MTYQLTVGDWSDDGHGKTSTFPFEGGNHPSECYNHAVKLLGWPDMKRFCEDYEDSTIPKAAYEFYKAQGIKFDDCDEEEDEYNINAEEFAALWLATANAGLQAATGSRGIPFKFVKSTNFNIGGYGLFD